MPAYIVRGAEPHVAEGDWPAAQRVVIVEFPLTRRLLFVEAIDGAGPVADFQATRCASPGYRTTNPNSSISSSAPKSPPTTSNRYVRMPRRV